MNDRTHQVYFSYKWGGESERIVNEIDAALKAKGIPFVRDKQDLGYKGNIGDFMREIGRGNAIVVVICDKYLKSVNTMFELVEIAKNKDVSERIFPVILQDANIYDPVSRLEYIKYWEDKKSELNAKMKELADQANLQGIREDIDNYDTIRDHISGLASLLKDLNALTPEMHENSKFSSLIDALEKQLPEAPAGETQGGVTEATSATENPWGPDAQDAFRVFLGTPNPDREGLHKQLSKALQALDGVRVVDSVPLDEQKHAETVDFLVRSADLCVHLLGADKGKQLDPDDGQPLRTYPLEQLDIGLQAARSQLVVMVDVDKESIEHEAYAAKLDELVKRDRPDKTRFEVLITDKNRITDEVEAKLKGLRNERQAPDPSGGAVLTALVDAHDVDCERANDLVTFLSERNVEAFMQTTDSSGAQFAHDLKKYPLYIIVAGQADKDWVKHRTNAARTSAVKSRAAILVSRYEGTEEGSVSMSRFKVVAAIKRVAPDPIESMFEPAADDKA